MNIKLNWQSFSYIKNKCGVNSRNTDDVFLFQYEGEIQVLNQVTIAPTLTNKKWSGKELAVRAGEKLDVIVNAVDNKLICRNDEGKCEYLQLIVRGCKNIYKYLRFPHNSFFYSSQHKIGRPKSKICFCVYFTVGYVSTGHIFTE